ncbi:phosphatase PAP2 family protein [Streptomyces sp. bgisy159]|uniref:phosphatase PAP2 family protein n=1 Tax=Streptomyces sp. bgisy159 TaxID=3413795 RepID=UPI003F4A11F0
MRTERNLTRLDRVFARLDREPERPALRDMPSMSRHRVALFAATLAFYLAIVWLVVTTSWLVRLDWQVMFFRPYQQWPEVHAFLDYYVVLGQRGPTAVMVAAWLGWRSWRQHTLRPLLTLGASLLLLNLTVGAAKIGMGRLGPHYATTIGSNEMWLGGDIFPSGHTANAVVTWGILAYLASTPRARRWLSALSAVTSLGVGLTTVYLGTHWLSDVLLGWAAGLLILLALPWCEPLIARSEAWILALRDRLRDGRTGTAPAPVVVPLRARPTSASSLGEAATGAAAETITAPHETAAVPDAGVLRTAAPPQEAAPDRDAVLAREAAPAREATAVREATPVQEATAARKPTPAPAQEATAAREAGAVREAAARETRAGQETATARDTAPHREPAAPVRGSAARPPAYLAPGPHHGRSERTPVTPAGSRRPPHADRAPRSAATSAARPLTGG